MDLPTPWIVAIILAIAGAFLLRRQQQDGATLEQSPSSFTHDLSLMAARGTLEPFDGREKEVDRAMHIIMRRSKNNPLLIGNPGVGKTAIVHGLAQRIHDGDVPKSLVGKRVLSLDLNAILAGSQYRGEMEKRLRSLLGSLERDSRKIILFIDEVHMLAQAGGAQGSLNISDILKPALSRGDLQIIGATTWDEYERDIRPDQALDRRFQPVLVDEPNQQQALKMLKAVRDVYQDFHKVKIPDAVLKAAVKLSDERIRGRFLPDKAIDLIDEAAAKVAIDCSVTSHGKHLGVIHAAARACKTPTVTQGDIADVVDQWVVHSQAESKRDARRKVKVS